MRVRAYLETGSKRVFACALDWPGWCRAGKDEELAISALASYAPRYAKVARLSRIPFPAGNPVIEVVERVRGSATTDFGAPGVVTGADRARLTSKDLDRLTALVAASWRAFDGVAARAPAALRKGPRGGGRDRDAIVKHVREAEVAYAGKLGLRLSWPPATGAAEVEANRKALLAALRVRASDEHPPEKGWPPRYAARRIAWHALDHAWEIEDRSVPQPAS